MEIKPKYISYKKRCLKLLKKLIIGAIFLILYVLLRSPSNLEILLLFVIIIPLMGIYLFSFIRKSKYYLAKIRIEGDSCEFVVYEYDKIKGIYRTSLSKTRIKIVMLYFPFTHFGTSYKLVVETKKGILYNVLIQQYEIGDWHLDKFKEALALYGRTKGVPVSPQSYKRTMF